MPPNRKGTFDAVDNLATLQVSQFVDQAKYQPLTTPALTQSKTAPAVVVEEVQQLQLQPDAKQATIDRILLEEKLREQFSADHMIHANQRQEEEKTEVHRETTDSDDYWAMTTPNDLSDEVRAKHTDSSYWDWQSKTKEETKDDMIQAILEEERIRQLFSVDHMVEKIQEEAAGLQKKKILLSQNDDYWSWDGKVAESANEVPVDKEKVIQKLRQQFSVDVLEKKLMEERKDEEVSRADPQNDEYWAGF
jgi:hypothetical protein